MGDARDLLPGASWGSVFPPSVLSPGLSRRDGKPEGGGRREDAGLRRPAPDDSRHARPRGAPPRRGGRQEARAPSRLSGCPARRGVGGGAGAGAGGDRAAIVPQPRPGLPPPPAPPLWPSPALGAAALRPRLQMAPGRPCAAPCAGQGCSPGAHPGGAAALCQALGRARSPDAPPARSPARARARAATYRGALAARPLARARCGAILGSR